MLLNLEPVTPGYIITFNTSDEWCDFWVQLSAKMSALILIDKSCKVKVPFAPGLAARVKFDRHGNIGDWGWDELYCYNNSSTYNEYIRIEFSDACFHPLDMPGITQTIDQLLEV